MRSEPYFWLWVFRLNGKIKENVGELTLWVFQRLDVDEPRPNTLEDSDLPINTDVGRWVQPVSDRCGPATFPGECEWVAAYSPGKSRTLEMGPWTGTLRQVPSSAPARSSNASRDAPIQGPDPTTMVKIRGHYR